MVRKYNLDEHIAEGDPLHPETHEAIAEAVNDLDDRTADIETDLTTRLSPTELNATFGAAIVASELRDHLSLTSADGHTDFFVKGVNWGPLVNAGGNGYTKQWIIDYDESVADLNIDRAADLGFNLVRIMGTYKSYTIDPALYINRVKHVFEKARSRGLKVEFCALTNSLSGDEFIGAEYAAGYAAYFGDLIGAYAGDPLIFGWDGLNEWTNETDNGEATLEVLTLIASGIRAADPLSRVTFGATGTVGINPAEVDKIYPLVDYISIHDYSTITPEKYGMVQEMSHFPAYFGDKPFIISEIGVNSRTGSDPIVSNSISAQAAQAAMRYKFAKIPTWGGMVWHKITDAPGSVNGQGLYDDMGPSGTLRPRAIEAAKAYDHHPTMVNDLISHRVHPIVLDNFMRAPSSISPGTSPLGGTPSDLGGNTGWGISSFNRLQRVSNTGGTSCLVWDAHTSQVDVEAELIAIEGTTAGIVIGAQNLDNRIAVYYSRTGSVGTLSAIQRVGGETTGILKSRTGSLYTSTTDFGLIGGLVKLRMVIARGRYEIWVQGKMLTQNMTDGILDNQFTSNTKHGVMLAESDSGTLFTRLRISTDGVAWP